MESRIKDNGELVIENGTLIYRNFKGLASEYNKDGNRTFAVLLDEDISDELTKEGWYVKRQKPKPDDPKQYQQPYIQVKVKFTNYPPVIYLISKDGKTKLTEELVGDLDRAVIQNADLIIRPYRYPARNGRPEGVSAYLKSAYITILDDDDFADKYSNIPSVNSDGSVVVDSLNRPEDDEEAPFE